MRTAHANRAAFLALSLGLCGCRAIEMTADVAGELLRTTADVAGHAAGAAGAAVTFEPREVIEHAAGAAREAVQGVGSVAKAATNGAGKILR